MYKIMAKAIINRLKNILNSIISITQTAFIPKRMIANNVIVAYEAMHSMHEGFQRIHGY